MKSPLFRYVLPALFLGCLAISTIDAQGPIRRWIGQRQFERSMAGQSVQRSVVNGQEVFCIDGTCYTSDGVPVVARTPLFRIAEQPRTAVATGSAPTAKVVPVATAAFSAPIETEATDKLHRAVLRAAVEAQRKGAINRAELLRLRVAMISPGFRRNVEDLALIQIASSGDSGPLQYGPDGEIIREAVDWEGLAAFLEKLVPLILLLLKAFGVAVLHLLGLLLGLL